MLKTIPCEVLQRVLNESILVHNPDEAVFSLVPIVQLEDTIPFYYTLDDGSREFTVPRIATSNNSDFTKVFYLYDRCNLTDCDKLVLKYHEAITKKINEALDETGVSLTSGGLKGALKVVPYGMYKKCKIHGCRGCCCNGKEKAQDGIGSHGVDWAGMASSLVSSFNAY